MLVVKDAEQYRLSRVELIVHFLKRLSKSKGPILGAPKPYAYFRDWDPGTKIPAG